MKRILFILFIGFLVQSCDSKEEAVEVESNPCLTDGLLNTNVDCSSDYLPVCGCNGITYQNSCVAEFNFGVSSITNGPCADDPSCINLDSIGDMNQCGEYYQPVCGCDGITYVNSCIADSSGVTQYQYGACGIIDFGVCKESELEIGVIYEDDNTLYSWSPQVHLSCYECPRPTLKVESDTLYTLSMHNKRDLNEAPRLKRYQIRALVCK